MGDKSKIEWTEATWNPIVGCSIVSPGCTNCYAMKMAARIEKIALSAHYDGLTEASKSGAVWTGIIAQSPEHILTQPLRWKRGRKIFVNSMGDLFHESVPNEWIDRVFAVMALCPQHTFQVLTKRAERMRDYLSTRNGMGNSALCHAINDIPAHLGNRHGALQMPLPNVWLGVSAERQQEADERIPLLLQTPAAVRFVSCEPLLGPVNLEPWLAWPENRYVNDRPWGCIGCDSACDCPAGKAVYLDKEGPPDKNGVPTWVTADRATLDQVIVGGESGLHARPMHPDWARSLRDQCVAAGVAFFIKQWGEWAPMPKWYENHRTSLPCQVWKGNCWSDDGGMEGEWLVRVGKKRAGRLLDGKEHNAFPHQEPNQ